MTAEDRQIVDLLLKRTRKGQVPWREYEFNRYNPLRQILVARATFGSNDLMFEIVYQPMAIGIAAPAERIRLNVRRISDKVETTIRPTDAEVERLLIQLYDAARLTASGQSSDPNKRAIIEALEN